jgi:hypothetical protein
MDGSNILRMMLVLTITLVGAIVLHEIGHLVIARLFKWKAKLTFYYENWHSFGIAVDVFPNYDADKFLLRYCIVSFGGSLFSVLWLILSTVVGVLPVLIFVVLAIFVVGYGIDETAKNYPTRE